MSEPSTYHSVAAFAAALFEPEDIVEVRLLPSKERRWVRAADLSSSPNIAWLRERNDAGQNIYVGANPRSTFDGGSAEHVALARAVFVDFDGGTEPDEAKSRVSSAGLPDASIVVNSGGGTHCYWLLSEPLLDLIRFTRIQKVLIQRLGSDDVVHDAPRIMRMPGFVNHKYAPPRDAVLVEAHRDRRYEQSAFPLAKPTVAPRTPAAAKAAGRKGLSRDTLLFLAEGACKGERNKSCFSAACDFAGCSIAQEDAERDLLDTATRLNMFEPGDFDEAQTRASVASAYAKPREPARAAGGVQGFEIAVQPSTPSDTGDATPRSIFVEHTPAAEKGKFKLVVKRQDVVLFTDELRVSSAHSRRRFTKDLEQRCQGIDADNLDWHLNQLAAAPATENKRVAEESTRSRDELIKHGDEIAEEALAAMPPSVVREAEELLSDPRLFDQIVSDLGAVGIVGEQELASTVYIVGTSRLLEKPLSGITQGVTSSGKSFVAERGARLFPPEALLLATDITTNALYYLEPGALIHRFVVAGERPRRDDDDRAEATRALREMISAGELRKVVPVRRADGRMTAEVLWQPGPIAFIESTTKAQVFDEDANRCLLLGTDESPEQTHRIVMAQAAKAAGDEPDHTSIVARHHALQRLLRRCHVQIPFAGAIARAIPTNRQEARRAMPQVLSVIRAVTILHQRQRSGDVLVHGSRIAATIDDYVIARRLLSDPMGRSLGGGLPGAVTRFAERLISEYGTREFTSSDVVRSDGTIRAKGKVNDYLRALSEAGVVTCTEQGKGNQPAKWQVTGEIPSAGSLWLPTSDQLGGGQ